MANPSRKMFVNLPVRDLAGAMKFFRSLGFDFDARFTDEKAARMAIGVDAYVMLLAEPFFRTFTRRQVCDTASQVEGLFAISCDSREEVDALATRALSAGGRRAMEPRDHGFMYGWSFCDLDGHQWEVVWMDPEVASVSGLRPGRPGKMR